MRGLLLQVEPGTVPDDLTTEPVDEEVQRVPEQGEDGDRQQLEPERHTQFEHGLTVASDPVRPHRSRDDIRPGQRA